MNNKTLADEIITLITHFANDNPAPIVAEMIREYEDGYIDVRTEEGDYLHIPLIGSYGDYKECVVVFIDGRYNGGYAITQGALKTSELENDSNFLTTADIPTKTSDLTNDSGFLTTADIPTKTSDLENDSGFITSANIPTKTSDLTNDSNFISTSSTSGLIRNDGSIDTTSYLSSLPSHTHQSSDITDLINVIYPVGSIYMSVNSTSPATLFGGTWTQIEDTFLLACGSTYSNGATGGSKDAVVVSHAHRPYSTSLKFVSTADDLALNPTKRQIPPADNNGWHIAHGQQYTTGINDDQYTETVGTSGTNKNMPPYLAVYVWKRTA